MSKDFRRDDSQSIVTQLALVQSSMATFKEKQDSHHTKFNEINTSVGLMRLDMTEISASLRQLWESRKEDKEVMKDFKKVVENNTEAAQQSSRASEATMKELESLREAMENRGKKQNGVSFFREKLYGTLITALVYGFIALTGYGTIYFIQHVDKIAK